MMKKLVLTMLITSAIIFSGCSSKASNSPAANSNTNSSVTAADQTSNNAASSTATGNLKPIKPNTLPQLSTEQKKQIDSKMNSALKNLDSTLKSIQDPNDINLDSTN